MNEMPHRRRHRMPFRAETDFEDLERDPRIMALAGAIREEHRAGRRDRRRPRADGG